MSNHLESLRQLTTVVADTGDIDAIKRYQPVDATTNPSLLLNAAALPQYAPLIEQAITWAQQQSSDAAKQLTDAADKLAVLIGNEIAAIIPGRISTEVDARLSFDTAATIAKAQRLIELYEQAGLPSSRILIKIAATWEGIKAAEQLEKAGIQCNLTLLFSFAQARACAEAGVYLISPFVGRILDWHKKQHPETVFTADNDPGVASVTRIYEYYKSHGFNTVVMGASFRNIGEIQALAGCDRLTISPALLAELANTPGTLTPVLQDKGMTSAPSAFLTESAFRWQHNEDAMATEKLAEGIRNFTADQIKLEKLLQQRLHA